MVSNIFVRVRPWIGTTAADLSKGAGGSYLNGTRDVDPRRHAGTVLASACPIPADADRHRHPRHLDEQRHISAAGTPKVKNKRQGAC